VVISYPVTISNGQPIAGTYQQAITWDPILFSPYEAADLGNIRFCADAACATPLNGWLESCSPTCAPSASSATAWVELTGVVVPASGVSTIYMGFMTTNTEFDANYWGRSIDIAPGYDNGSNVFLYYNNGQSTANFTVANGLAGALADTVQVNPLGVSTNVITVTGSGVVTNSQETVAWYNNAIGGDNLVMEGWINIGFNNNPVTYNQNCMFAYRGASASAATLTNYIDGIGWSGTFLGIAYEAAPPPAGGTNTYLGTGGGGRQNGWFWSYTTLSGTAMTASVWNQQPELGGVQASTITVSNALISSANQYMGLAVWAGANAPAYFYQWRARTFPPAGVPSTATVSVPPVNCYGEIVTNQSATQATPVPFQQQLTYYPTTYALLERPNLGNTRFCADSTCAVPLYAWLEGCNGAGNGACSPAASSATVWINLPAAIPAGGSQTIYQCFVSTTVSFDGVYWGESTDIAAGQDNGVFVFPYYNNGQSFAELSPPLNGALTAPNAANPYGPVTPVITLTPTAVVATGQAVAWSTAAVLGDNMIIEGWVNRNANRAAMLAVRGNNSATTTDYLLGEGFNGANAATVEYENANVGTLLGSNGAYPAAGWYWSYGVVTGSQLNNAIFSKQPEFGGAQIATTTVANAALPNTDQYVGIAAAANALTAARFYEWRVRNYYSGGTSVVVDTIAPTAVANLAAADLGVSSAALSWSAPSDQNYDPINGLYAIQYASYTAGVVWSTANAQVLISTTGVTPAAAQSTVITGLLTNTSYYFSLWTQDQGLVWSALSNGATTVTLANPISAATGKLVSITASSATVGWAALPAAPSSSTCEGYELDASSTNFASGTIYSSTTFSDLASTLAVAGLNTGTTMYFRVATLNWSGARNYVSLSSANVEISTSIITIIMGLDATVQLSTVSVSSVVVTNTGNVPVTLVVSGSTITAGCPWVLSVAAGIEKPVLQGEWNAAQPAAASFATAITSAPVSSVTGGNYAGGQSGQAVPPGGSITMWFKFSAPTATAAANTPELIQVVYQAVYP